MKGLPLVEDERVLVGMSKPDDAGVYKLRDDLALVQTVDYFTAVVDDPYDFGRIACANALSDVYAMGARPITALNLVGFPKDVLDLEILREILKGGLDKAREAGISILGGHTIDDPEPKYGLAVTGLVHPDRIWTNATARPGDALVLTKPLGTGIASTAIKGGEADGDLIRTVTEQMSSLNRFAAEAAQEVGISACTDITGFGLLGHLSEMTLSSSVSAVIYADRLPVLDGIMELIAMGMVPAGTYANLRFVEGRVSFTENVDRETQILAADAQTSGGLLISLPSDRTPALLSALEARGVKGVVVGGIVPRRDPEILLQR